MATRKHETSDDGESRKYFAMLPHTFIKGRRGRGLSLPARWLYVYLKSVANENGECGKSTTTIAKEAQLGRGTIPAAKEELAKAGLITIATQREGYHEAVKIRIVDIWPDNMEEFKNRGCSPHEQPKDDCSRDEQHCSPHEQPLNHSNTLDMSPDCSPHEQPVISGCSSHELSCSPHEPNKNPLKKQNKDLPPVVPPQTLAAVNGVQAAVQPKRRPARFVPENFAVTDELCTWAAREVPGLNIDFETGKFRDYEFKVGRSDWNMAWRNWMRKAWEALPPEAKRPRNGGYYHEHVEL